MYALRSAAARLVARSTPFSSTAQVSRLSLLRQFAAPTTTRPFHQASRFLQESASAERSTDNVYSSDALSEASTSRHADSFGRPPTKRLYVGNLFFAVTAQMLEAEFAKFGTVVSCKIKEDNRGYSKGFGFVEFSDLDSAIRASQEMHQRIFEGRRLLVGYTEQRAAPVKTPREFTEMDPTRSLYIGNMSFQMSDKDLNDLFSDFHDALDVRVSIDRRSGQPRGFAHIDFIDIESAQKAKDVLSEKVVLGRQLRVTFCETRPGNKGANRQNPTATPASDQSS